MFENTRNIANNIIIIAKQVEEEQNKAKKRILLQEIEKHIQILEKDLEEKINKKITIGWLEKKQILEELRLNEKDIKSIYIPEKKRTPLRIYVTFANIIFEPISEKIITLFPRLSQNFQKIVLEAGLNILSISYLSITLLSIILILFLGTTLGVIIFYAYSLWYSIFLGLLLCLTASSAFYFYPIYTARKRKKELEEELPFFINHCATLANIGIKTKDIFDIISLTTYYKAFKIDCKRIINSTNLLNMSLEESLKQSAKTNPSKKTKIFFEELAKAIEEKIDLKIFLSEKAKESVKNYKQQKNFIKRYINHWEDIQETFSLKGYSFTTFVILTGIIMFYLYRPTIDKIFISSLAGGIFLFLIPLTIKILKNLQQRQRQEKQFLLLLQKLKETKNLLKINSDFKELQINVQKLQNQYKTGIPKDKAWNTFGKDTRNPLIIATITMSQEAKNRGANFYTALYELGTSKLIRKVLKN